MMLGLWTEYNMLFYLVHLLYIYGCIKISKLLRRDNKNFRKLFGKWMYGNSCLRERFQLSHIGCCCRRKPCNTTKTSWVFHIQYNADSMAGRGNVFIHPRQWEQFNADKLASNSSNSQRTKIIVIGIATFSMLMLLQTFFTRTSLPSGSPLPSAHSSALIIRTAAWRESRTCSGNITHFQRTTSYRASISQNGTTSSW